MSDSNTFVVLAVPSGDRVHHVHGGFNGRWCNPNFPVGPRDLFIGIREGDRESSAEEIIADLTVCSKCRKGVERWLTQ